jgi:RNA polymerase sigma factor (sigma-70 family)
MEDSAKDRLLQLRAWKEQRKEVAAAPRRATNRELLAVVRDTRTTDAERSRAADTLRRQIKTLCAAAISRCGDATLSGGDLEDLTQDVLIRLLQSPESADPTPAYIAKVAANLLIDQRRHRARRGLNLAPVSLDEPEDGDGPAREFIDPEENVEETVLTRLAETSLRATIEKLLKPGEATVVLRRAEGAAHDEIAAELGQSCASVRKQYERGLRRLQAHAESGYLVA